MSIANTATVKMVQNVINGTTPLKAAAIGDAAFPVGTILQRTDSVSPASLFGGTWERIAGRFLLGDAGGGTLGETGGEETHTLTSSEMPSHKHSITIDSGGSHSHTLGAFSDSTGTAGGKYEAWRGGSGLSTNSGGSHTHTASIGYTGSGGAHNNMPPYIKVSIWKRIA